MLKIGAMSIDRVVDLDPFRLPVGLIFPALSSAALNHHRALLAPDHVDFDARCILLALQSHVVRAGGLTILIDTCVGEHKRRPLRAEWNEREATGYLARLAAIGVDAAAVDIVLCTHLHADHVGWNTQLRDGRWVPTFPRARYVFGTRELAYWQQRVDTEEPGAVSHGAWSDSVQPVLDAGRHRVVEAGDSLAEGVVIRALPGHTPGQIGLDISDGSAAAIFCGDAIHSPLQVVLPELSTAFCTDQAQARMTRHHLLETVADTDTILIPAHLRAAGMRVHRRGDAFFPSFCACT